MSLETLTVAGSQWFWENYGKALTDMALGKVREQWSKTQWTRIESKYRARLQELYGTTRLLGNPKPIIIEEIYTDVYVLDKLTAFKRYDYSTLQDRVFEHKSFQLSEKRKAALHLITNEKRSFILGKPGAGKTTLLKYLTIQACKGLTTKTPIFIPMKEWADSELDLQSFIAKQFEICAFPDSAKFIDFLLNKGDALMLFDGLDEIKKEGHQRAQIMQTLTNFARRYPNIQICVTCRIAATEYSFDDFTYFEIADFDEKQIRLFAARWYRNEPANLSRFLIELDKPEHQNLLELASTPLLLALLCLTFEDLGYIPERRVDLYRDALDTLLQKWDTTRGIERGEIYRRLTTTVKKKLLSKLAAQNFESGKYLIRQETLAGQISNYLISLADDNVSEVPDGEVVLKAIEAQHGTLVERASNIFSFSHLTLQEYLTAVYIVDNKNSGAIARLIHNHLTDDRWHEVFLITASLLDDDNSFFEIFANDLSKMVSKSNHLVNILNWIIQYYKGNQINASDRAIIIHKLAEYGLRYNMVLLGRTYAGKSLNPRASLIDRVSSHINALQQLSNLAQNLAHSIKKDLDVNKIEVPSSEGERIITALTSPQINALLTYLKANMLLIECMRLSTISNKDGVIEQLLLPSKGRSHT